MEGGDQTEMSLDEIIQSKHIQAPPSTSYVSRRLTQPFSKRGRGFAFAKPSRPRDPGLAMQTAKDLLEAAYRAGVAAAMGMQRSGFQRGGFQRGGFQRIGMQQRMGMHRPIPPTFHRPGPMVRPPYPQQRSQQSAVQLPIPGIKTEPSVPRNELSRIQISIPADGVGKPPLRDRLGWYPWQHLTPAQQVARGKLSLAKMRLNGPSINRQGFATRAFAAGILRGRQDRIHSSPRWQRQQPRVPQPDWSTLETGVSPLLRHNVARLPGNRGPSAGQSVKSASALSNHSRRSAKSRNKLANQRYLAERQFDDNASASMSTAALQERMRPRVPWGSFNRPGKHNPRLDRQLQEEIGNLQALARQAQGGQPRQEDFEYSALVVATQTTSSDRFTLMMTLTPPTQPQPLGFDPNAV